MWEMLFVRVNGTEAQFPSHRQQFDTAVQHTDALIAGVRQRWEELKDLRIDPVTATRIDEGLERVKAVTGWRDVVRSSGRTPLPEMTSSRYYTDRLERYKREVPERALEQATFDY